MSVFSDSSFLKGPLHAIAVIPRLVLRVSFWAGMCHFETLGRSATDVDEEKLRGRKVLAAAV